MHTEVIESSVRPGAMGAVAKSHEHPEEEVHSDRADGHKADISGKVEDGEAHWQQQANIGFETVRNSLTFHGMLC